MLTCSPARLLLTAAAALLAAGLAGCGNSDSKPQAPKAKRAAEAVPVLAATVEQRTVPVQLRAVGNVETLASVAVKSRVDGQILSVHFGDGDEVKAGQLLFQIDPRPSEAALRQAEANLLKDRAQLDYARSQEARYQDLLQKNFVSKEAYAQVRTSLEAAQAAVAADEAGIEAARLQLQYATIRSPIGGRAGKLLVSAGNLVKANDTEPLVVINQISPIYVSFAVAEQYGPEIRAAMRERRLPVEATIAGAPGRTVSGELAFVDNTVDAASGTLRLRGRFANDGHLLWPGDFVEAVLTLREEAGAIVVPATAVLTGPKGNYAFVVGKDQAVEQRPITVARADDSIAVIAGGLAAGETVVTDGASRLTAGARISLKSAGRGE